MPLYNRGDVFYAYDHADHATSLIVVTVNAGRTTPDGKPMKKFGVMGAGIAKKAAQRWPSLPDWWDRQVRVGVDKGFYHFARIDLNVGLLVTKREWYQSSTLELVELGLLDMVAWANQNPNIKSIFLPMPGCGNGNLSRPQVRPLLEKHLDVRFTVCDFGER